MKLLLLIGSAYWSDRLIMMMVVPLNPSITLQREKIKHDILICPFCEGKITNNLSITQQVLKVDTDTQYFEWSASQNIIILSNNDQIKYCLVRVCICEVISTFLTELCFLNCLSQINNCLVLRFGPDRNILTTFGKTAAQVCKSSELSQTLKTSPYWRQAGG